ncbi:MAG: hypothetical protein ACJ79A_01870 [Gemmatimonadaceae bacterium]
MIWILAATALVALLALPGSRDALEGVMASHMLVQIPLLALAGAMAVRGVPLAWRSRIAGWNRRGVAGTTLALLASTWWMVPRALDLALASPAMEVTKFASLPLVVGAPLALSWRPLGGMGRGFVLANVLPMWAVVGWLYVVAPVRVCNFYLVDEQVTTGVGLLVASVAVGVAAGVLAFRSGSPAR